MSKRKRVSRKKSRAVFRKTANKTLAVNVSPPVPMRGGFRI